MQSTSIHHILATNLIGKSIRVFQIPGYGEEGSFEYSASPWGGREVSEITVSILEVNVNAPKGTIRLIFRPKNSLASVDIKLSDSLLFV